MYGEHHASKRLPKRSDAFYICLNTSAIYNIGGKYKYVFNKQANSVLLNIQEKSKRSELELSNVSAS